MSLLDTRLFDTHFGNVFPGSIGPNGRKVQLGQVAIYCRVSTDDQSCERQERDLRAFAKRADHEIVAVFRETASGAKNDRAERKRVMALAQARKIDAILVTELSRWGRSTQDLVQTLDDLHSWKVSVLAQTGLSFDLSTSSGKLMRTIMAGLAEFERDLIRERVKSGLSAAKARGIVLGRKVGQRPSDKKAKKVLQLHEEGLSYRLIGRNVGLSKNTVMDIIRREAPAA
jgi:putative DNA-invertase from lambdoid prophage Rac